jgi:asparagine synthase (glutamine-hydrolysing)
VALEREVLAALSRPPCLINFSGGRDSSAMLALATTLARREGLPEPIALTWRFPAHPSTHEAGWQERVVEHLALSEWERLEFDEELDVLGEIATGVLRSHGLLWPATAHLNLAALARARGGTVIFCADMREVFDGWGFARAQAVLRGRVRPEPRDLRRIAVSLVPRRARRRIGAAESARHHAWLRPKAQRELFERSGGRFGVPRRWDRWVAWFAEERAVRLAKQSLEILARDHDVVASHPMSSPSVLSALADEGGAAGFGERPELTRHLFGDLVPKDLLMRRPTRGEFGTALWASRSRAFAATWDGTGVDPRLVDRDRHMLRSK